MADTSFLENTTSTDPLLLQQINTDCDKLVELKMQMMLAEEKFEAAKKAYSDFATKQIPQLFKNNGLDMIATASGTRVRIVTKTRASILKGQDDGRTSKEIIAKWLREHDADHLIKEQLICPQSQLEALKQAGITFQEDMNINTNSLKSLIIDMLGQNGGVPVINKDDLPEGLSFYQWDEAEIG